MEAKLMVLNSSTLANDNSRWPKLAPSAADIVAEAGAVGVGERPDTLIRPRLCTIERECVPVSAVFNPVRPT